MNIRRSRWQSLVAAAGVACLALTAAACGSSSSSSTSTPTVSSSATGTASATGSPSATSTGSAASSVPSIPASLTGTAKTIATNWVAFFNPKTPTATRLSLLENGSTFASALQGQATNPQAQLTAAQVTAVTVSSSSAATVTWNLLLSGTAVLTNQKGSAVYQDGAWKVSDSSFCGLLKLSGPAPAACG